MRSNRCRGEIAEHLPKLAAKRRLNETLLFAALQAMPIDWKLPEDYEDQRGEAQQRISHRDPDDWPTVALALKLELPIWSQDKDMDDAGLRVLTTGEPLDAIRAVEHNE